MLKAKTGDTAAKNFSYLSFCQSLDQAKPFLCRHVNAFNRVNVGLSEFFDVLEIIRAR